MNREPGYLDLSLDDLSKLRHYDEIKQQYIVERDIARSAQAKLAAAEKERDEALSSVRLASFEALAKTFKKRMEAAERVVKQSRTVIEFFEDRWCEDHAYRARHLNPLKEAIAAYDEAKRGEP